MKLKNLQLSIDTITNGGPMLKKSIKKGTLYKDNKATNETDGTYRIECIMPDNDLDTIIVKVEEKSVDDDVLNAKALTPLDFIDFEAHIWLPGNGKLPMVVAKAVSVKVSEEEIEF